MQSIEKAKQILEVNEQSNLTNELEIIMNSLKLAALISAVMLTLAGMAQAESVSGHEESAQRLNHNFSSKRSYHAPVDLSKSQKAEEQFEGATLVPKDEDSVESKKERNLKQLRINSLGRRPYMQ